MYVSCRLSSKVARAVHPSLSLARPTQAARSLPPKGRERQNVSRYLGSTEQKKRQDNPRALFKTCRDRDGDVSGEQQRNRISP